MSRALEPQLRAGIQALGLALDEVQLSQLLSYVDLIQKWTRVYNLTAVRDPQDMLTHHLLDSLAVVQPLRRQLAALDLDGSVRVLDVGAGAGLPGVVLAICCPGMVVHCVDAVAKKAAFVQQVAVNLKLTRLRGLHARVERLSECYDVVCSRAFASLSDFTEWSAGALAPQGVWMAMKGKHPHDELLALNSGTQVFKLESVVVPGLDAERCLVWMRRAQAPGH